MTGIKCSSIPLTTNENGELDGCTSILSNAIASITPGEAAALLEKIKMASGIPNASTPQIPATV
jgi:hypothetical protein